MPSSKEDATYIEKMLSGSFINLYDEFIEIYRKIPLLQISLIYNSSLKKFSFQSICWKIFSTKFKMDEMWTKSNHNWNEIFDEKIHKNYLRSNKCKCLNKNQVKLSFTWFDQVELPRTDLYIHSQIAQDIIFKCFCIGNCHYELWTMTASTDIRVDTVRSS